MADQIPIDEYDRWVSPHRAFELLKPVNRITVISALKAAIRSGVIRTAAHLIIDVTPGFSAQQQGSYELISPGSWIDLTEDRFWALGSITITPPIYRTTLASVAGATDRHIELTGVRLDPVGLEQLIAQLRPAPSPQQMLGEAFRKTVMRGAARVAGLPQVQAEQRAPNEPLSPKVSQKELRVWYKAQFAENPNLTFPVVHSLATAHFKPRRVTRQPLRNVIGELGHTANPGNPTIRRK